MTICWLGSKGRWALALGSGQRTNEFEAHRPLFSLARRQKLIANSLPVLLLLCVGLAAMGDTRPPAPSYDLFLKSDYGQVRLWLNTRTGDFRWEDPARKLDLTGRGTVAFPNLGPIVFSYAGPMPGYDWVSLTLKIYGTRATGLMAVFPEGQPTRKAVSNFYDRDTRDDVPPAPRPPKARPKPKPPTVEGIHSAPKEVQLPPKP